MTARPTLTLCPHAPVPALPSEGMIGVIAPAGPAPLDTDKAVHASGNLEPEEVAQA